MKIWKITCCNECPSLTSFYDVKGQHDYCNMTKQKIKDIHKLPKWCPLPNEGEDNERNTNTKSN